MSAVSNWWIYLLFRLGLGWAGSCGHIGILGATLFWVVATTADTTDKIEGIVEEAMVYEETVEEVGYGETGFLDGSSSTQETKNSVGLVTVSKSSRS